MKLEELPAAAQVDLLAAHGLAKPKKKSAISKAAELLEFQMRAHRMEGWKREHRFAMEALHKGWRFDFAHLEYRLAVEVEGLRIQVIAGKAYCTGRHTTPDGFREDCRKYNAAVDLGWQVLRFDQQMIKGGEAIAQIERVLWKHNYPRTDKLGQR